MSLRTSREDLRVIAVPSDTDNQRGSLRDALVLAEPLGPTKAALAKRCCSSGRRDRVAVAAIAAAGGPGGPAAGGPAHRGGRTGGQDR